MPICVLLPQAGLNEKIQANGGQVPKKVITAPFVQIPLGITEDRLVGTVDIEASMKVGNVSSITLMAEYLCAMQNAYLLLHCLGDKKTCVCSLKIV